MTLNNVKDIPIEQLYDHPVVQQLLSKIDGDLEASVKVPYVMKEKILMSPGVWNGYFYGSKAIQEAFLQSEWNRKEIRSLFLDHEDLKSKEWIGEVINPRLKNDTIVGDLIVVDKPTAMKLAYGAKMGISPKVSGKQDDGKMVSFKFDNFSVVINPAVKTAYINNMQKEDAGKDDVEEMVKAKEDVAKPYGDIEYADPGYKDNKARYPIDTEKHVRAAWSYIHQSKNRTDYTADQLKAIETRIAQAAVKFNINVKEVKKMAEEEEAKPVESQDKPVEPAAKEETTTEAPAEAKPAEKEAPAKVENTEAEVTENSDDVVEALAGVSDVAKKAKEIRKKNPEMKWTDAIKEAAKMSKEMEEEKPAEKPVEEVKPTEEAPKETKENQEKEEDNTATEMNKLSDKLSEKDNIISEMSERLKKVEDKLNEPDKASSKVAELSQSNEDPDMAFINMLKAC